MHPILITLAITPGLIWLLFYLRKDVHPESNPMVLKIFLLGALSAIPALFVELGFFALSLPEFLNIFIGVALTEELLKYFVVRQKVFSSPELDEPLDIMLYCIIAALGFATLENLLLFLSPPVFSLKVGETFALAGFRFISATFLHALVSGTLGFFLALGFFKLKKKLLLFLSGIFVAVLLHGIYNWAIITEVRYLKLSVPVLIITFLAFFVSWCFKKLKKMESICKI